MPPGVLLLKITRVRKGSWTLGLYFLTSSSPPPPTPHWPGLWLCGHRSAGNLTEAASDLLANKISHHFPGLSDEGGSCLVFLRGQPPPSLLPAVSVCVLLTHSWKTGVSGPAFLEAGYLWPPRHVLDVAASVSRMCHVDITASPPAWAPSLRNFLFLNREESRYLPCPPFRSCYYI